MPFTVSFLPGFSPMRCGAAVAAFAGAALLSGCVVAPLDDGYGYTDYGYSSTTVYTTYGSPPPPRVEYRYAAPSPAHVWMGGDWFWGGSRYDWRPGHWAPPGYRPPPPPPRPMVQPPRPQMRPPAPPPGRPMFRPDERPRPPQVRPGPQRPQPGQMQPGQRPPPQVRPNGGQRPPQARPDAAGPRPPQQVRPNAPRPENARPQRRDGDNRRAPPNRARDDDRRGPRP